MLKIVKQANKAFSDEHDADKIEKSIRYCQKRVKVYVMAKFAPKVFDHKEDSLGYKILNKRLSD